MSAADISIPDNKSTEVEAVGAGNEANHPISLIYSLPPEMLCEICDWLTPAAASRFSQTSRYFASIVQPHLFRGFAADEEKLLGYFMLGCVSGNIATIRRSIELGHPPSVDDAILDSHKMVVLKHHSTLLRNCCCRPERELNYYDCFTVNDDPATRYTTLAMAISFGRITVIDYLLSGAGATKVQDPEGGITPLMFTILHCGGDIERVVRYLLERGADPNQTSGEGQDSAFMMVMGGESMRDQMKAWRQEIRGLLVEIMVQHGADVNASGSGEDDTPLIREFRTQVRLRKLGLVDHDMTRVHNCLVELYERKLKQDDSIRADEKERVPLDGVVDEDTEKWATDVLLVLLRAGARVSRSDLNLIRGIVTEE